MWPFRRPRPVAELPTVDPALGDPAGAALLADLKRRDWRAAHDFLRTVDHPDDLDFYIDLTTRTPGLQAWVGEWIAAEPRSHLPLLVKGAHANVWAWQARGAARAKDTSPAQFQMFAYRLTVADSCLTAAASLNHDDPNTWSRLIVTGVGQSRGVPEAQRRFDEAIARYRWHGGAHQGLLKQLCAKWGGSDEELHRFAEESSAAAPPGSPLGVLIADAHVERWLDAPKDQNPPYFQLPEVRADLHTAAARSVRHPAFARRPGWPALHSTFAMAFWLADDYDAAAQQFDVLGDLAPGRSWRFFARRHPEVFARARAESHEKRAAPLPT